MRKEAMGKDERAVLAAGKGNGNVAQDGRNDCTCKDANANDNP